MYYLFSICKNTQQNSMEFHFRDQNFYSDILAYAEHVLKSTLLPFFVIIASLCLQVQYIGNSKSTPLCPLSQKYTFIHTLLPPASILTTGATATSRFL